MSTDREQVKIPFWRKLQMKFGASYVAIVVLILIILNTYPILNSQVMVFRTKQTSLQSQASVIASTLSALEELTEDGVSQVMEMLDESGLNRILVTDRTGLILYDTDTSNLDSERYALIAELIRAMNGYDVFVSTYKNGAFRSSAAVPVMYRNATIGGVYIYDYDSEQGSIITGLQQNLFRISLVLLAVALAISAVLARTMTRRISRLISGIGQLQKGTYSTRVKVSGKDELATLATAFNDMTERLEETDKVRRRFVSDASHELKTPLAAIKLLTDSIVQNEDMDVETMREFVEDIGTEADRLNRITEKLLTLTRMDNKKVPDRSDVNLTDVISDALHLLTPLAEAGQITIHTDLEEGCVVCSSPDEMYQVVFNLVENAIKYNAFGGKVWIRTRRGDARVTLTVEDTGIGIPKEDLGRIFDRFYRVDKTRSREAGGTGLGLSIVWDTLRANDGTITTETGQAGGTLFTVTLPLTSGQAEQEDKS